jgi:pilus assembly protein CpaE
MERGLLTGEQVQAGIDLLRVHFDQIVLDLRHDVDPGTVAALEAADTVLFVTSLNVSALRAGAAALAALRQLGLDPKKLKVVVMRDGTGDDVTVGHAREALGVPVYWKIPNEYATVMASINVGEPVMSTAPRSKFARSVRQLSEVLADDGRPVAASTARRSVSLLASCLSHGTVREPQR